MDKEKHNEETECCCLEHETFEDEDSLVICKSCKEWTSLVKCSGCNDVVFESACCG